MRATLLIKMHKPIGAASYYEMVVWHVPEPVAGSSHNYKYRMALVVENICVLRYDNERGKGDHKHVGDLEAAIEFTTLQALIRAFKTDMKRMTP